MKRRRRRRTVLPRPLRTARWRTAGRRKRRGSAPVAARRPAAAAWAFAIEAAAALDVEAGAALNPAAPAPERADADEEEEEAETVFEAAAGAAAGGAVMRLIISAKVWEVGAAWAGAPLASAACPAAAALAAWPCRRAPRERPGWRARRRRRSRPKPFPSVRPTGWRSQREWAGRRTCAETGFRVDGERILREAISTNHKQPPGQTPSH